jgi:hypothetical protein
MVRCHVERSETSLAISLVIGLELIRDSSLAQNDTIYGALALGVRACFTSNFAFLPSNDIR